MRFDLHLHTTASDGHLSAEQLVKAAIAAGLDAIAITDHDSVASVGPARDAAGGTSLRIIPGVELSSTHDGRDVHILGYFVDEADDMFLSRLVMLRDARLERAEGMVTALAEAGYEITLAEVLELSMGGAVGRSHIARALVDSGHAGSVAQAFAELLGRGRPFYRPKPVATPVEVVSIIRDAGGISVLAHPAVTQVDEIIPELLSAGLAGLEVYHGEHSGADRDRYASLAHELGLLATGGSDFHGPTAPGVPLGGVDMPASILPALIEAAHGLGRADRW